MLERRGDPLQHAHVARGEDVGGGGEAARARRQDLRRGLAAHELRPAEVQVAAPGSRPSRRRRGRRWRWRRRRGTPAASRRGGSAARCGGLRLVAAHEQRAVDAVALEQRDQHVAERVGPDRAGAAHLGAELGQHSAVPPAVPAAVMRISSTSAPPWPSGIASTGRTSTSRTCTHADDRASRGPRAPVAASATAEITARRCSSSSVARLADRGGAPVERRRPLEQSGRAHAASGRGRGRARRGWPSAPPTAPRAPRARRRRARRVPNVAYGATGSSRRGRASRSGRTAARRDARQRGGHRRVVCTTAPAL